jgi:hypothetical protein
MTERTTAMADDELGRALGAVAELIAWPEEPSMAAAVATSIRERERHPSLARPRLSIPSRRRTLVVVIAGLLLVGGAALATKLVIDLGALTIETIPGRPTSLPSAVASGPTYGHPATLAEAELEAGFHASIPAPLGVPDRVWFDRTAAGTRIILAWLATDAMPPIGDLPWGTVIYEFRGETAQAAKTLYAEGDTFGNTKVDGNAAFWITGEHELDMVTGDGTYARYRVTGNILVWDVAGTVVRMETELPKVAAIRLATSGDPAR